MSNIDLKELLGSLDSACINYLEKASHFCVQQQHPKVTVEHYLLQMLDNRTNPLNLLLESFDIDPINWIKLLLLRTKELKQDNAGNPVFSDELLNWFDSANTFVKSKSPVDKVQVKDLISSLIKNHEQYRSSGLIELTQFSIEGVESFFNNTVINDAVSETIAPESAQAEPAPVTDDQDGTIIMTDDEIADFSKAASTEIEISGYGNLEVIGEGGMATVYKANHLSLDREVALKVLRPGDETDDDFVARFLREARIVAKLAHPNIIQIYDVNQVDNITYLAMEFVTGGELSDCMDEGFDIENTIKILSQVLAALQSAHNKGFIHRDIKPANILFREDGSIVLTDFGIARAMHEDSDLTIAGSVLGTPRYMSPEQAKGEKLDHRSDLYSVGVLFYHMLEKKLPYAGETAMATAMKHILDPIPTLSDQWQSFQPFLDNAMAKLPNERFQSGDEMIAALTALK